jgi:septal ring factor EnvC (AmiA/AmiB activator)
LKRFRAILSVGLALTLFFLSFPFEHPAKASTGSDLKQQINDLTKQKQEKSNQVNQTKQKLQANKGKQQGVQQQLTDLQNQIAETNSKITTKQHTISNTKLQIADLQKQINVIKDRIKRRDVLLKQRVKAMYETGNSADYLQLLLASHNFGDFVGRVVMLGTIASQDKKILDQQRADKVHLDSQQSSVETKLTSLQKDVADLGNLQASLADKKKQQQSLLATLQSQQKDLEKEAFSQQEIADNVAKQAASAKAAYNLWKQEEARKAEAAKQTSSQGGSQGQTSRSTSSNAGAILAWPVAGGYVTSPYGPRAGGFHPGIDIGKGMGTPIHAAADGVVFRSYLSSSYGNCVMITHYINGQEYTTVYAHMESRSVSDGQVVHSGQVIGYMGDTGEAFGPHLHFEVYRGQWNPPPHPGTINPITVLP